MRSQLRSYDWLSKYAEYLRSFDPETKLAKTEEREPIFAFGGSARKDIGRKYHPTYPGEWNF